MASDAWDKLRNREIQPDAPRDAYGFEVKREYAGLHLRFQPLWAEEEAERSKLWLQFVQDLQRVAPEVGATEEQVLQHVLSHYDAPSSSAAEGGCGADPTLEAVACMEQLRALVQAGVPMASRGKYWQLFLRAGTKCQPGHYSELVRQALEQTPFAGSIPGSGSGALISLEGQAGGGEGEEHHGGDGCGGSQPKQKHQKQGGGLLGGVGSLGLPVVEILADSSSRGGGATGPSAGAASQHATFTITSQEIRPLQQSGGVGPVAGALKSCLPAEPNQHQQQQQYHQQQQQEQQQGMPPRALAEGGTGRASWPASPQSAASCSSSEGGVSSGDESIGSWRSKDWLGQIEKDLHRTFPGHPLMDASGREVLRRILAAYARHNPGVGYCQGMNFIAACFMLFMGEEDAFWCLAAVVEDLLPGYFDTRMVAPQVDQRVFGHLLQASFPTVMAHLERLEVDAASVCMQWFLCIFVNSLPLETCLRVWDMLFFEGSPVVLLRVALALVDVYHKALLECRECSDAYMLLQSMGPMSFDSSRLLDTACIAHGHIKDSALRVLRAKYRTPVLEQLRGSFSSDEDYRAYAYYGAAEPTHSRSQSFADALAQITAAASGSSPGAAPDQGHLAPSPATSCGSSSGSHTGNEGGSRSAGRRRSGEGAARPLLPAPRQPVSALTARLVPSSLPALLPSGALGARGEELPPQPEPRGASLDATRRHRGTADRGAAAGVVVGGHARHWRGASWAIEDQPVQLGPRPQGPPSLQLSPVPEGRERRAEVLRHISTQRAQQGGEGAGPGSSSQRERGSPASGAVLGRGGPRSFSPFSDPAAVLAGSGDGGNGDCGGGFPPRGALDGLQQGRSSGEIGPVQTSLAGAEAQEGQPGSTVDAVDVRGPVKAQRLDQQQHCEQQQLHWEHQALPGQSLPPHAALPPAGARQHRRALSAMLPWDHPPAQCPPQHRHSHRHRPSLVPDLHRLAAFVPDFRQPAVAAAYQIAANPSPHHPHPLPQLSVAAAASPTSCPYTCTPMSSSVLGLRGSGSSLVSRAWSFSEPAECTAASAGPVATASATQRGADCNPVRVLQFGPAGDKGEEDEGRETGCMGSRPSELLCGSGCTMLLPARRYTDGDVYLLGDCLEPWEGSQPAAPMAEAAQSSAGFSWPQDGPAAEGVSRARQWPLGQPSVTAPGAAQAAQDGGWRSGCTPAQHPCRSQTEAAVSPATALPAMAASLASPALTASAAGAIAAGAAAGAIAAGAAATPSYLSSPSSRAAVTAAEAARPSYSPTGSSAVAQQAAAAGADCSPSPSPSLRSSQHATPPTPRTCTQLLVVIEQLQEEVATAESWRHAAEQAAREARETNRQLQGQLDKLLRDVSNRELLLADLRGKVGAMTNELSEAEGELGAGRMAIEQLQRQVEERQQMLAEKDEFIRLLMDRACQRGLV